MAITAITSVDLAAGNSGVTRVAGTVAGPASYATGGLAADIVTDLGLSSVDSVIVQSDGAYIAVWDSANSKIKFCKVNTSTGLVEEATAATDVSGETVTIWALENH